MPAAIGSPGAGVRAGEYCDISATPTQTKVGCTYRRPGPLPGILRPPDWERQRLQGPSSQNVHRRLIGWAHGCKLSRRRRC